MLRLKQDELENQFDHRLREALAEQKISIESEINRWIRRMEAIEHVVDGRADIDRVAKENQALWLAVEALSYALEIPFSKIGATGVFEARSKDIKPFYVSEPLEKYVCAVKETAGQRHSFPCVIVGSIPQEVLSDGVWTRQGLLQRFKRVSHFCTCFLKTPRERLRLLLYLARLPTYFRTDLLFDKFDLFVSLR